MNQGTENIETSNHNSEHVSDPPTYTHGSFWGALSGDKASKNTASTSQQVNGSSVDRIDDLLENPASQYNADDDCRAPVENMLRRIANSDAHFKHQQRGDPELSLENKLRIAKDVFEKNPATFLSRFGKYLHKVDLDIFEPLKNDYVVGFYLAEIQKQLNDRANDMTKRNRRFEAMKKMTSDGDYFEEESMKSRDPLLYEQMVGRYLTEEQVHTRVQDKDLGFASVLLEHVQSLQENELYDRLKDIEEGQKQEEEDSSEEDMDLNGEEEGEQINDVEKQMLRNEFLRTMQIRFLNGEDTEHFDYKQVDENMEYDSLDIRERDEEEKYFDDDDSEDIEEDPSVQNLSKQMDDLATTSNVRVNASDGAAYSYSSPKLTELNACTITNNMESFTSEHCSSNKDHGLTAGGCSRCQKIDCACNDTSRDKVSNSETNSIDYEDYEVTEDICPGLLQNETNTRNWGEFSENNIEENG